MLHNIVSPCVLVNYTIGYCLGSLESVLPDTALHCTAQVVFNNLFGITITMLSYYTVLTPLVKQYYATPSPILTLLHPLDKNQLY